MLLNLHIKNYALIENLHLEFKPGLNFFTGETGAGKSIIIESLGLILGERASARTVRNGAERCSITGEFEISNLVSLRKLLEDQDLLENDTLILRREIYSNGKSRAFINDRPVSLTTLAAACEHLVDIHGQHEHQSLIRPSSHRHLLDSFGNLEDLRIKVFESYQLYKSLITKKETREISSMEKQRLIDLYTFQLSEIEMANLRTGEDEEIVQSLPQLKNAEKLMELTGQAYQLLYESEGAVLEKLNNVNRIMETIYTLTETPGESLENLKNAYYQIEEVSSEIKSFSDRLSSDPEKLNELLERRDLIERLKKKYGKTIDQIIEYSEVISKDLSDLNAADQNRQELEKNIEKQVSLLTAICKKLTDARKLSGKNLAVEITKELTDLGMKKARFEVAVEKAPDFTSEGSDRVEFMFSPNQGEGIKPIREIASGGEMSRVMLAIKTVLAKADHVPVLVFDEIDAGIGGPMGQVVGKKMSLLAKYHQILCITHLPQIAAFAHQHMFVEKEVKSGRTNTNVRVLSKTDRTEEIARMLSGNEITSTARKHAEEMIDSSYKS